MLRFHLQFNVANDSYDLRCVDDKRKEGGVVYAATNVTFEESPPSHMVNPVLQLPPEAAQSLADQLWEVGVRPTSAVRAIESASQTAGGHTAPWLMRQLEKFIDKATKGE